MGSAVGENERTATKRDRAAPLEYEGVHRMFDAIEGIPPSTPSPDLWRSSRPPTSGAVGDSTRRAELVASVAYF